MQVPMAMGIIAASILACTTTVRSEEAGDVEIRRAIEEYCTTVSDLAAERRAARQTSALKELQAKVESRLNELEQHADDLAERVQKREALRVLADKELVEIYSGVDAEAAAAQMERLDLRLASSVLRQLKPRQASAILNVMKPELAAQLVRLIANSDSNGRVSQ